MKSVTSEHRIQGKEWGELYGRRSPRSRRLSLQNRTPWHAAPLSSIGCALEPTVGLLNHSCDPNTCRVNVGRATLVYATRDIVEDEEVGRWETVMPKTPEILSKCKEFLAWKHASLSGDRHIPSFLPDNSSRWTEIRAPKEVWVPLPMQVGRHQWRLVSFKFKQSS